MLTFWGDCDVTSGSGSPGTIEPENSEKRPPSRSNSREDRAKTGAPQRSQRTAKIAPAIRSYGGFLPMLTVLSFMISLITGVFVH